MIATGVTTNGNGGAGSSRLRVAVKTFIATNNAGPGYFGYYRGGRLIDATLQFNDTLANNDLVSARGPRLLGTSTCAGNSSQFSAGVGRFGTWNVCDGD